MRIGRARSRGRAAASISRRPTACGTRSGGWPAPIATRSSRRFRGFRRSTSPTVIIVRPAPRGRATRFATRRRRGRRSATAPTSTRCSAVAFPHDQVQILPYNRVVKDLGRLTPDAFSQAVQRAVRRPAGPAAPAAARRDRRCTSAARGGRFGRARPPDRVDAIASLDVSVLQDRLLAPVLGDRRRPDRQADRFRRRRPRHRRARALVDRAGRRRLLAVSRSVADLMAVSDAGEIMPPKSTWFEPKLRDGLLIHVHLTRQSGAHDDRQRIFNFSAGPAVLPCRCSKRFSATSWRCRASACRFSKSATGRRRSRRSSRRPKPTSARSRRSRRTTGAVPAGRRQPAVLDGADEPARRRSDGRLHRRRVVGGEGDQGSEEGRQRATSPARPRASNYARIPAQPS